MSGERFSALPKEVGAVLSSEDLFSREEGTCCAEFSGGVEDEAERIERVRQAIKSMSQKHRERGSVMDSIYPFSLPRRDGNRINPFILGGLTALPLSFPEIISALASPEALGGFVGLGGLVETWWFLKGFFDKDEGFAPFGQPSPLPRFNRPPKNFKGLVIGKMEPSKEIYTEPFDYVGKTLGLVALLLGGGFNSPTLEIIGGGAYLLGKVAKWAAEFVRSGREIVVTTSGEVYKRWRGKGDLISPDVEPKGSIKQIMITSRRGILDWILGTMRIKMSYVGKKENIVVNEFMEGKQAKAFMHIAGTFRDSAIRRMDDSGVKHGLHFLLGERQDNFRRTASEHLGKDIIEAFRRVLVNEQGEIVSIARGKIKLEFLQDTQNSVPKIPAVENNAGKYKDLSGFLIRVFAAKEGYYDENKRAELVNLGKRFYKELNRSNLSKKMFRLALVRGAIPFTPDQVDLDSQSEEFLMGLGILYQHLTGKRRFTREGFNTIFSNMRWELPAYLGGLNPFKLTEEEIRNLLPTLIEVSLVLNSGSVYESFIPSVRYPVEKGQNFVVNSINRLRQRFLPYLVRYRWIRKSLSEGLSEEVGKIGSRKIRGREIVAAFASFIYGTGFLFLYLTGSGIVSGALENALFFPLIAKFVFKSFPGVASIKSAPPAPETLKEIHFLRNKLNLGNFKGGVTEELMELYKKSFDL